MSEPTARPWWRGWLDAIAAYRQPRVAAMLFLGFSAGLPFMLVFSTLSAWLREVGIERATIGMLSWVGRIYSIKIFWAPVVDRLPLPLLGRMLGRRRSWMLVAQAGIALGLFNIAHLDPVGHLGRKRKQNSRRYGKGTKTTSARPFQKSPKSRKPNGPPTLTPPPPRAEWGWA